MKKIYSFLLVLVVLTSAFAFNIGKASALSYPTLTDVHFVTGKGIVFVFDLNGMRLRGPNLKGATLYLHGNPYPLACLVDKEDGKIVCTVRGGLTEFAGDQGSVSLLDRLYTVIIPSLPAKPVVIPPDECAPAFGIHKSVQACEQ
jgi:hypothetical protein